MWEIEHRAMGFQIANCYSSVASVAHSNSGLGAGGGSLGFQRYCFVSGVQHVFACA